MSITGIIGTLIIGFFAGLIARLLKPGDDTMGILRCLKQEFTGCLR